MGGTGADAGGGMAVHDGVWSKTAPNIPGNEITKCCNAAATSSDGAVLGVFRFRNYMGSDLMAVAFIFHRGLLMHTPAKVAN
jgi:hypothetical protein